MNLEPAQSTAHKTRTLNLANLPLTSNIIIMLLLKASEQILLQQGRKDY